MPKGCALGTAAVGLALLSVGCVATREPLAAIDPEYSYVRDGGVILSDAAVGRSPAGELAIELRLDENGMLQPAGVRGTQFVQAGTLGLAE